MKIEMLAWTPEPEKLVAAAAKLCYSKTGASGLMEKLSDEQVENFLSMLTELGHDSPLEHMTFTFAVEEVSRVLTHQLVRHRMASYSQQSQRYVKLEQFEYIVPPAISANKVALELYKEAMAADQVVYDKLVAALQADHVEKLLTQGVDEKKANQQAEKMAIEDARYVFPNACETKIVVTMNGRSLMNFFEHRCCERAQWEIRMLADLMLIEVRKVAPTIFKTAGPKCLTAPCPEGRMSCGKMVQTRNKYKDLEKTINLLVDQL
jgi:thymidylate synthase (FAD)